VEYSVERNERVSAYLCVPKQRITKTAAAFYHHPHNSEFSLGKSEVVGLDGHPDQAYAAELTERDYITSAPDAIAFEERNWSGGNSEAEYYELASRLVRGHTLLAKVIHDAAVGIDYLASRSEVDAERIGFLVHSYGGRMAIWLAAVDHRIRATVSHCGCVGYADSLYRGAGIQMEFCVPGIMEHGDIEDIVALIAPKPLCISAATEDVWSQGAQRIYQAALPPFAGSVLELRLWPVGQAFTQPMREAAYHFPISTSGDLPAQWGVRRTVAAEPNSPICRMQCLLHAVQAEMFEAAELRLWKRDFDAPMSRHHRCVPARVFFRSFLEAKQLCIDFVLIEGEAWRKSNPVELELRTE
jgi:dienelactone hydrolase